MLVVTSKPDDRARVLAAARRAGKSGDVIVIDDSPESHRLNFLQVVLAGVRGDDATKSQVAAAAFSNFTEVADRGRRSGGGEDSAFWKSSADRLVRYGFHLTLFARRTPSLPLLLRLVQSLPSAPSDLTDAGWKGGPLNQTLRETYANRAGREAEYDELAAYFLGEMANLAGMAKSIVQATVAGVADSVSRGLAGRLLATDSTFDLGRAIEHGAVVVCDIPAEYGDVARLVNVGVKAMWRGWSTSASRRCARRRCCGGG